MRNKFLSLILEERILSLKIGAILFLSIISIFLQRSALLNKQELVRLLKDKVTVQDLARQIPSLEEKLRSLQAQKEVSGDLKPRVGLSLKGILIKGGQSVALINDDIYQKNDMVAGYMITSISTNTVTLEDPATGEESKLQLPE